MVTHCQNRNFATFSTAVVPLMIPLHKHVTAVVRICSGLSML